METEGVWRTICGRRVFIREGQSLTDAMRESGKFKDPKVEALPQETYFRIGISLGAKAKVYEVEDKSTGIVYPLIEGSYVRDAQVFAGRGTKHPLRDEVAEGLTREFGGDPQKWQHAKGVGSLDDFGTERKAEIHWFQEETVGKVKFKVKRWLDED